MSHAEQMDAKAYWRQFTTGFYFEKISDSIAGHLVALAEEGPRNDPEPRLVIQTKDGTRRSVVASQERLKAALQDACPAVGDQIRITYVGDAEKALRGMTKAKLFAVEVRRKGSQPPGRPSGEALGEVAGENAPEAGT